MRGRVEGCVAWLACGFLFGACGGEAQRGQRIVVITVDTLRHDCFTSEGMPETRAFAGRGLIYDNFYASAASTQPTHASLFTGLHPWQHGVVRNGCVLGDGLETVAERLGERGYATGAVVSSFPVHSQFGLAQGFDAYDDLFTFERKRIKDEWQGVKTTGEYFYSISDDITDKAIATLSAMAPGNQFLWVHYFDPHDPYGDHEEIPAVYFRLRMLARRQSPMLGPTIERARLLYAKDIRRMDGQLGRLFRFLDEEGGDHDTHVLLTSDHGESFGERGGPFGHGHHMIEEQLHVPAFIVSPRISPGVNEEAAGTVDFAATILALAGDTRRSTQGRDLSQLDANRDAEASFGVYGMRSVFDTEVKVVQADGRELRVDTPRFYAIRDGSIWSGDGIELLQADEAPSELPAYADELNQLFMRFKATLERAQTEELDDPATRAALEALGYGE